MLEAREGFVFHVLSKEDKATGLHIFNRVEKPDPDEGTLGKLIRYESEEPLGIWIPVDFPVQQEYVNRMNYSTELGNSKLTSVEACLGRFIVHKSESIWAGYKKDCPDGGVFDDAEDIRNTCAEWDGQSNGRGRRPPEFSRSALEEMSEEEKIALMQKYFTVVD